MNSRLFAILIVFCLAFAAGGCAFFDNMSGKDQGEKPPKKDKKPLPEEVSKPRREIVLPRQTGSNFERRIVLDDDESSVKKKTKPHESKPPAKKIVKAEQTEPEQAEPEPEPKKPKQPAEPPSTTPLPDRFR